MSFIGDRQEVSLNRSMAAIKRRIWGDDTQKVLKSDLDDPLLSRICFLSGLIRDLPLVTFEYTTMKMANLIKCNVYAMDLLLLHLFWFSFNVAEAQYAFI